MGHTFSAGTDNLSCSRTSLHSDMQEDVRMVNAELVAGPKLARKRMDAKSEVRTHADFRPVLFCIQKLKSTSITTTRFSRGKEDSACL